MTTSLRRTLLMTAAILPLSAALASAQYRVDNNAVRDANNRVGSGGFNDNTGATRLGGLAGNYIVTGNVTGGRAFRGNLGYTDASQFRGGLGSNDFDSFVRDSSSVGQLRGSYSNGINNNSTPQPFFGNRTAAAPAGFVRSPTDNGTFVQRKATQVLPNDGRADYGGASRSDVMQSLINSQGRYNNTGVPQPAAAPFAGAMVDPFSPLQLSEYTSLARARRDIYASNDPTSPMTAANNPQSDSITGLAATGMAANRTDASDPSTLVPDNRLDSSAAIQTQPDATTPGDTGQSITRVSNRAADNNTQYAKLRDRLAQVRGEQPQRGGAIDNRAPGATPMGGPTLTDSGTVSTGQGTQPGTVSRRPTDGAAGDKPGDKPANDTAKPADGATPAAPADAAPGLKFPAGGDAAPKAAADNLQLPRPEGNATAAKPAAPIEITSLASGVKNAKLAKVLTDAESMMKAGKFGSAIDTYERAEEIASDDPLVFMGRSIAELGGGYYRNAEVHLRQAFAADDSLLFAKFDLRAMIGDDRLNTLANNLSDIAGKNEKDAGPLLLLAFIYYNGGMEDKAARALDMAQVRAGGKDHDVEALRKNWSFDASPPADLNK